MFPKEFCVENGAKLVSVAGCAVHKVDVCIADVNLAVSKSCAG